MRKSIRIPRAFLFIMIACAGTSNAWDEREHRKLAESSLEAVASACGWNKGDSIVAAVHSGIVIRLPKKLWMNSSFGELCAAYSLEDLSRARLCDRGKTVLEQLRPLSKEKITAAWNPLTAAGLPNVFTVPTIRSFEMGNTNAVANYLLHHLMAFRFADLAGRSPDLASEAFRRALIYEAMAQGYLADAFSAGHLLIPCSDRFYPLHGYNNKTIHDHYNNEGVYVVNSRGDVWRTFGDKLLEWYAPSCRAVKKACVTSLYEVFACLAAAGGDGILPDPLAQWAGSAGLDVEASAAVRHWTEIRNGEDYYVQMRLPTLLLLPMPVPATWSVRTDIVDTLGIHKRIHFPQLMEDGFHDPDLRGIDTRFLYPQEAVLNTMIPDLVSLNKPEESKDDSVSNGGRRFETPFRGGNGGQPGMMPDSCRQEWIPFKGGASVASVRYIQDRHFSPPYRGWLFSAAAGSASRDKNCASTISLGIGFGIADDILIILNRFSVEVDWMRSCNKNQWSYILPSAGIGIKINEILKRVKSNVAVRFETGYAVGTGLSSHQGGFKSAVGIESATIPLGFTYTGVCFRLKVQRIWLQNRLDGVFLETVLY